MYLSIQHDICDIYDQNNMTEINSFDIYPWHKQSVYGTCHEIILQTTWKKIPGGWVTPEIILLNDLKTPQKWRLAFPGPLSLSVAVSNLQVAILARSSREMYQTVCIDWKHFLSRVHILVRPRHFFIREKHPKTIANTESPAWSPAPHDRPRDCSLEWTSDVGKCGHGWAPPTRRTHCDHSGDRLSQNGEQQQFKTRVYTFTPGDALRDTSHRCPWPVKTATMTVYSFTAWKVWFRNYYVAHAFVVFIKINNEELVFNAVPFYFSSA